MTFTVKGDASEKWLRYRHLIPNHTDWETIEQGYLPARMDARNGGAGLKGKLISDYYCYNDRAYAGKENLIGTIQTPGTHWVGDVGLEADLEVQSSSGELILDTVEAGAHFRCTIDVATGKATLSCSDPSVKFASASSKAAVASPQAQTAIRGAGSYVVKYANCDDRIFLWVNNKPVEFDAADFSRQATMRPRYSAKDPADAEPLGVASKNLDLKVTRLKVLRDVYYTSPPSATKNIQNETGQNPNVIATIHDNPDRWESKSGIRLFASRKNIQEPMFVLEADQFLPMGDNSPESLDGRVWGPHPNYVHRDMLIGRALFIYWPHSLNSPKYFPNFKRMNFIR